MALTFPTPYTVGHHAYSDGAVDAHNIPAPGYIPPKDQPGTPVAVIGWAPPGSTARPDLGDRVIIDVELFAPPGFTPKPRDLIDLPEAGQFECVGYPEDFNHGFHQWKPGNVIKLRRVEG